MKFRRQVFTGTVEVAPTARPANMSRLASLGWQTKQVAHEDPRTGETTVTEYPYRLLVDPHRTSEMYVQWGDENGSVEPIDKSIGTTTTRRPLGTFSAKGFNTGRYPAAKSDKVTPLDEYNG